MTWERMNRSCTDPLTLKGICRTIHHKDLLLVWGNEGKTPEWSRFKVIQSLKKIEELAFVLEFPRLIE